jgi:methylmalonyl-CoA mutase N-terminal domain/subunit
VTHTIDPLGGSYFIEALTNQMEEEALAYIRKIDEMGGMVEALDRHYPQMEIADSAYKFQQQIDRGEKTMVGVNKYVTGEPPPVEILKIDPELEAKQIARLHQVKNDRNNKKVRECLERLGEACVNNENVMPFLIQAVKEYASLQECCDVYRKVFGRYRDPGIF